MSIFASRQKNPLHSHISVPFSRNHLFHAQDELDQIYATMKKHIGSKPPTKSNLFNTYLTRVKQNLHMVVCMSPIGEIFRARLRQFPSLVTCCTIDWFTEWPREALESVAKEFLCELPALDNNEKLIENMADMCVYMHQTIVTGSDEFLGELGRHNYVTPTSYLELLKVFTKLIGIKAGEIKTQKDRMSIGLNKLLKTADDVAVMQQELEDMKPQLAIAQRETDETIVQIEKDTIVANETKKVVTEKEVDASEKAAKSTEIKTSAERDLAEALPALEEALKSLKNLKKDDIVEVRSLQRPPGGVKLVMEAVCIMQGVKPKMEAGEKPGTKIANYWDNGKKQLLSDIPRFLESLFKFDKDNIPEDRIKKIQPYIDDPDFTPANIEKVSTACKSLCMWARAMHKYDQVAKSIAPKRAALEQADAELEEVNKILSAAKAELFEVESNLEKLQVTYERTASKKKELEDNVELCKHRLIRADKLIGGLADEKVRWAQMVEKLTRDMVNVIGDILISSGSVAYCAPFTENYRHKFIQLWRDCLERFHVPGNGDASLINTMSDPVKVRSWQIYGLPKDNKSTENAVTVQFSERWPLFIREVGEIWKFQCWGKMPWVWVWARVLRGCLREEP